MKLSTRSRYGTRLMLDMAEHYQEGPIQLRTIAERQGIPVKYLEQIIIPLKKAGYVTSVRGYKGGHMLAKPPQEITAGEIVALLEGGRRLALCTDDPGICRRAETCVTRLLWKEATEAMYEKLSAYTLADLLMMVRAHGRAGVPDSICDREQG
jgi:Rrf2 family iron-sulfur cluster assembly transcriptional regulator